MTRTGLATLQRLVPHRHGVQILAYHLVGAGTVSPVDVTAADFRGQMEELAGDGSVVSLDSALALLRNGGAARQPAVVLTFDDAYRNFLTDAWPLLRDLGLPATLFVPTAFIEHGEPLPMSAAGALPPMSWDELARTEEDGVTLGSHGHSHRELRSLSESEMDRDLGRARELLHRRTGSDAAHFCYPRAAWSRRCEGVVGRLHQTACIAGGRLNRPARFQPLRLSRVPVRRELGPSLAPLLHRAVWLSEWTADHLRRPRALWQRWRGRP